MTTRARRSPRADRVSWNPLYEAWRLAVPVDRHTDRFAWYMTMGADAMIAAVHAREDAIRDYAFAIPTLDAVDAIVAAAPRIVELGAGTGYWAKLLAAAGADVVALDGVPTGKRNTYGSHDNGQLIGRWYPVTTGDASSLAAYADRALFLCWPPMDSTASDAIATWRGDVLIYVGEQGGCTADDAFFATVDDAFDQIAELQLPQWPGIHDYLWIARRRGRP